MRISLNPAAKRANFSLPPTACSGMIATCGSPGISGAGDGQISVSFAPTTIAAPRTTEIPTTSRTDRSTFVDRCGFVRHNVLFVTDTARRAKATSRADSNRSPGCFSRHRLTMASIGGGTSGHTSRIGMGSLPRMANMTSVEVSPTNARLPVRTSYITHPREKMSLRASTACPSICSGAI